MKKSPMNISSSLIDRICEFEGFHPDEYIENKKKKIGYGHVGYIQGPISEKEAKELLLSDLATIETYLNMLRYDWTQNKFDACADLCYSIGLKNFIRSAMRTHLVGGKKFVKTMILNWRWSYEDGKLVILDKTIKRREFELNLWNKEEDAE